MGKSLAAAVVVALVTGCNYGAASFHCEADQQCGAGGRCEMSSGGLCSFRDDSCPSGYRFGELAGGSSNRCVGEQPPPIDAAIDVAIDAAIDAPPDAPPDAQTCFSSASLVGLSLNICLESAPSGTRTISGTTPLNTDASDMCTAVMSGGTGLCVVAAATISIEGTLRATGSKALVLLARDTITIAMSGTIDVASRRSANPAIGAGGDPGTCASAMLPTQANGTNGGGAGGSFAGAGGKGGNGGGVTGGVGGTAAPIVASITELRGGCAGQDGQGGGATKGSTGHGGGAVFLLAGSTIMVAGKINASGGGGGGGVSGEAGGGGGGSGGLIALDAPTITGASSAQIFANGGGGGEGSGTNAPQSSGSPGGDPTSVAVALGGSGGTTNGADGGNGSAGATASGTMGVSSIAGAGNGGGGGGGGGAGLIKIPATANLGGTMVSPPALP